MDRRGVDGGARAGHNRQSFRRVLPYWSPLNLRRFNSPGLVSPSLSGRQHTTHGPELMARAGFPVHFSAVLRRTSALLDEYARLPAWRALRIGKM